MRLEHRTEQRRNAVDGRRDECAAQRGARQRSSGRHRSRLAAIGLALVLVLLAGFSLWTAVRTNAAARQVNQDTAEQDVWQNSRVDLARAEVARHAHANRGRPTARADLARATQAVHDDIRYIVQHADPPTSSSPTRWRPT